MNINSIQELFYQLIKTTTSTEIREILSSIGDVAEIGLSKPFGNLNLQWLPYGGTISNYSSIGLGSKPGRSITERLTNAIDAVIEAHSINVSKLPLSPQAAVNEWFGRPYSNSDSGLYNWEYSKGNFDRKVALIINDSGKKESPTVDILDYGIGISPENFASTILSLQGGNKITKKYLVGAFGQGGASTLAFSEYVLIVSRHINNPNIVSFTLIKEITLGEDYKENCYAYLSVYESDQIIVPYFILESALQIYDTKEKLRMSDLMKGTLVRHYSFGLSNIAKPLSPFEGNLYHFLHCSLFDPLVPFQIIDLRNKENIKQEISTGSRNRLMKIVAKSDSEIDGSNTEYKLYRPYAFITPYGTTLPCVKIEYWVIFNYERKKNKKTGVEFKDLRTDSNALYVQKKHLAILTVNGQNQGELTISQVAKDLGLDLVSRHLVIQIDATDAPATVKRGLFSTNRETVKDGDVLDSIKQELRRILSEDEQLKAIQIELEEKEISAVTESTDDDVKKEIVKLLREAGLVPSTDGEAVRQGKGETIDNPQTSKPRTQRDPPTPLLPLETLPYPEVTKFEIVSPNDKLKLHLNKTALILVETNADIKFKNEIRIKVEPGLLKESSYFPLEGGRVKWRLKTDEGAKIGDTGKIIVSLTKPNGDQIKDEIEYIVLEPLEKPATEEKGIIPDFEVLPISPGDTNWEKAWPNIPEDSEERFSVAYVPRKIGMKTIVYYSTIFNPFKSTLETLRSTNNPLYKFFETNYKVWIGYHGILQYNNLLNENSDDSDTLENKIEYEREKERVLVAQMQVKQALKTSELMLTINKQKRSGSD